MDSQHQYEGFVRQRRNLVLFSIFALFLVVCGVEFDKIGVLGNTVEINYPERVLYFIYLIFIYFAWRYYQYQRLVGSPGLEEAREALISGQLRELIESRGLSRYGKEYDAVRSAWVGTSNPRFGGRLWERYECRVVLVVDEGNGTAKDSYGNQIERNVFIHRSDIAALHRLSTMSVIFRTPYFSEYLLPYLMAGISLIGCAIFSII